MRFSLILTAAGTIGALAACSSAVPDSGASVGFQDYATYQAQREAALAGRGAPVNLNAYGQPVAPVGPANPPAGGFSTERLGAAIDAAESGGAVGAPYAAPVTAPGQPGAVIGQDVGASLSADRPRGDAPMTIAQQSGEVNPNNIGISDEQDFSAVAARETIESDAERLARNRAAYQVIQPTAVPQRSADTGPNIVQFALSTSHMPGTPAYKRPGIRTSNTNSACQRLGSPDRAQQAFLAAGGPQKDPKGLDPDGDGFVCGWDPRPFRAVTN
jgi:hypothetical protein